MTSKRGGDKVEGLQKTNYMTEDKKEPIKGLDEIKEVFNVESDRQNQEIKELSEKTELEKDQFDHKKIRQELEAIDLDDESKNQVTHHASDFQSLEIQQKTEKLLHLAKEKGVVFAINVAKKMDDPFVLDTFHDLLVKEGYYKKFLK